MSRLNILFYLLKLTQKLMPGYIIKPIINAAFKAVMPFLNIIVVKYIIEELMGGRDQMLLIRYVLILVIGNFVLRIIDKYFEMLLAIDIYRVHNIFSSYLGKKCTEIDFEHIEDVEVLDLKEKAFFALFNMNAVDNVLRQFSNIVYYIVVIGGLFYLLFELSPLLLTLLFTTVVINALIYYYISILTYNVEKNAISGNRAYMYYLNLSSDFTIAKDVRLYSGVSMIVSRIKDFTDRLLAHFTPFNLKKGKLMGVISVINQVQLVIIYFYLAYQVLNNAISIGQLTMYATAVTTLTLTLSSFIESFTEINLNCQHLKFFIEFDKFSVNPASDEVDISAVKDMTIRFNDVSFKYPRAENWVLKNVNITIRPGEKLSIVGLNGAGKTTFIKLLTGLYKPTSGTITLGGIAIDKINYQDYVKLLAVVFQDFKMLSYSIKDNIVNEQADDAKLVSCLEKAGFSNDLAVLEKGVDTSIYKNFDKLGVEFSGGQLQKLALARALYKDAPIVILDEPTAALDPISEYEVYNHFNNMVGAKTAIFISHRLSSTRLSDNIAVFSDGTIAEYGTHNQLMNKSAIYAKMYQTQAHLYL